MVTDITKFFNKESGSTFQKKPAKEQKIHFDSFNYTDEFKKHSDRRKSFYTKYYSNLKKELRTVLNLSEREYNKGNRKKVMSGDNKEGIALAILAMRNQLFEQAQYSNMEKAYKSGYDIPENKIGVKLTNEDRTDIAAISKVKDEFRSDVDRFVTDMADRIDKIVDQHEEKEENGINWTWIALGVALFAAVDAMEYRMGYIAVEPFRLSFRAGAIHGIVKATKKNGLKVQKWLWETTSVKPCERCQSIDGTEVTLEQAERFLHPNCKCTLTIVVK